MLKGLLQRGVTAAEKAVEEKPVAQKSLDDQIVGAEKVAADALARHDALKREHDGLLARIEVLTREHRTARGVALVANKPMPPEPGELVEAQRHVLELADALPISFRQASMAEAAANALRDDKSQGELAAITAARQEILRRSANVAEKLIELLAVLDVRHAKQMHAVCSDLLRGMVHPPAFRRDDAGPKDHLALHTPASLGGHRVRWSGARADGISCPLDADSIIAHYGRETFLG